MAARKRNPAGPLRASIGLTPTLVQRARGSCFTAEKSTQNRETNIALRKFRQGINCASCFPKDGREAPERSELIMPES